MNKNHLPPQRVAPATSSLMLALTGSLLMSGNTPPPSRFSQGWNKLTTSIWANVRMNLTARGLEPLSAWAESQNHISLPLSLMLTLMLMLTLSQLHVIEL